MNLAPVQVERVQCGSAGHSLSIGPSLAPSLCSVLFSLERQSVFSISVETRAGVTRHHLDSAIDALAIVEDMQKETHLPIVITDRAVGRVLTVEELRRLANLERSRAHRT